MTAREEELRVVERLAERHPKAALKSLADLDERGTPPAIRAQAKALQAILTSANGSERGLRSADALIQKASRQAKGHKVAMARVAHAKGYVAYKRGESTLMLSELNAAVRLYSARDRRRAHVFDTLGMYFVSIGDLDRARAYYLRSVENKEKAGADEAAGLAVTYGNLGRLELSRARHEEAEDWFRKDLEVLASLDVAPSILALVQNQLARGLLGQGEDRLEEAEDLLRGALRLASEGSINEAYIRKDMAEALRLGGKLADARRELRSARQIAERVNVPEMNAHLDWLEGLLVPRAAKRSGSDRVAEAQNHLRRAGEAFARLEMHIELCQVAMDEAELLVAADRSDEALAILVDVALPTAERHLFQEHDPLGLIEARIQELEPVALSRLRMRRMLGGYDPEELTGRLLGARQRITVWTCDIRGFTQFCEETDDPMQIVAMLNRFFKALGQAILDHGGRIDKYVGDNILAFFTDPVAAAGVAIEALQRVERLNTEREHLDERRLEIGVGLATGEVVVGNVGFAGKLEHTIIGPAVNTACRLVGRAEPGEILIDDVTRDAMGKGFVTRQKGSRRMRLKGIGAVRVYRLTGRRRARRRRAAKSS